MFLAIFLIFGAAGFLASRFRVLSGMCVMSMGLGFVMAGHWLIGGACFIGGIFWAASDE